jgi:hypothetical protein
MVENGGATAIDLGGGDLIVINGVANAALSASDFVFKATTSAEIGGKIIGIAEPEPFILLGVEGDPLHLGL